MDRFEFINAFHKAPAKVNKKRLKELTLRSINSKYGNGEVIGHHNLIIVTEELAELSQQVSKAARGKLDKMGMIEEMGDVTWMLVYLQEICGITREDISKAVNVKLDKLENTLNKDGVYL